MKKKGFILIIILIVIVIISLIVIKVCKKNTVILNPAPDNKKGLLDIVYYNPVEGKVCSEKEYINDLKNYKKANNVKTPTNQKEGCMKWYAYDETDTMYTMILDHNTTAGVAYNSNDNTTCNEACTKLTEDTSSWKVTARMITADEVADITGNSSWTSNDRYFYFDSNSTTQTAKSQGASKYSWLFDYTYDCEVYGCSTKDNTHFIFGDWASLLFGYWTSTPVDGNSNRVWSVAYWGALNDPSSLARDIGVRPVITISK